MRRLFLPPRQTTNVVSLLPSATGGPRRRLRPALVGIGCAAILCAVVRTPAVRAESAPPALRSEFRLLGLSAPRSPVASSATATLALQSLPTENSASDASSRYARPRYRWKLDAPLAASGLAALLIVRNLPTDIKTVPPEGLPRSDVVLALDRRAIGDNDTGAGTTSDRTEYSALAFPILLRIVSARNQDRIRAPLGMALLYVESMAMAEGIAGILKPVVSRPRPFAYLPESDRQPSGRLYDVTAERTFQSFPSGHATSAWCAVSVGVCDHLLSRPAASWVEHAAVGFVGGVLATTTSSLRVEAGQHFPTDVLAGMMIGVTSGTAVPLLHRYVSGRDRMPMPPRASWLGAASGIATGIVGGLFVAEIIQD